MQRASPISRLPAPFQTATFHLQGEGPSLARSRIQADDSRVPEGPRFPAFRWLTPRDPKVPVNVTVCALALDGAGIHCRRNRLAFRVTWDKIPCTHFDVRLQQKHSGRKHKEQQGLGISRNAFGAMRHLSIS